MRTRGARGLGLVEVVLVLVLSLGLLVTLHQLLWPLLKTNSRTAVKVHLRQQGAQSLAHLARDLRAAGGSGLSYFQESDRSVLSLSKVETLAASGRVAYSPDLVLYTWEEGEIRRRVWSPGQPEIAPSISPDRPTLLNENQLLAFLQTGTKARLLARGVTAFQPLDKWPVSGVVRASLTLRQKAGPNDFLELTVEKSIAFRNQ